MKGKKEACNACEPSVTGLISCQIHGTDANVAEEREVEGKDKTTATGSSRLAQMSLAILRHSLVSHWGEREQKPVAQNPVLLFPLPPAELNPRALAGTL